MALDPRRAFDRAPSFGVSAARLGSGMSVGATGKRPAEPLALYEFEACPYCRKVREVLSVLDLDAMVYPCPKDGPRYREEVRRRGGKAPVPYLVDPNSRQAMYESDDIVRYLCTTYGDGTVPRLLNLGALTDVTMMFAGAWRATAGMSYRRARAPEQPLELWSFEASPFCRLAREALCRLELPY